MRINAGGLSSVLIGRESEIKTLKLYSNLGQHCAVIAPRRYGKTTLVNYVLSELKTDFLISSVDVFTASTIKELSQIIIDAVYKSIGISNFIKSAKENILELISKLKITIEDVSLGYDILKEQDENELLRKSLDFPEQFAKKHKKKMILFFDEFGDANRFGEEIIKKMRAAFQLHSNVIYIFAGSQESVMKNTFLNKSTAFFNFCSVMLLDKLDVSSVSNYLANLSIDGRMFNYAACEKIIIISECHPYYLMKIIQEAYISCVLTGKSEVCEINVNEAKQKILQSNHSFYQEEWDRINQKKYKGAVLKEVMGFFADDKILRGKISSSYKSQLIRELINESILDSNKKIVDPFFGLWLKG